MPVTPPYDYTTYLNLGLWLDGDTPGATALNANWSTLDSVIWAVSQSVAYTANYPIKITANVIGLNYNTTNLMLSASTHLNTIQNIATTSSPTFAGLSINGNISASGNVTASNVRLTGNINASGNVTASNGLFSGNINVNGNTKFGDTSDDTHQFTGSIYTSGSIRITQPALTGYFSGLTIGNSAEYWNILEGSSYQLIIAHNQVPQITLLSTGNEIRFGSNTADTNLYRDGTNLLKTDDTFHAALNLSASNLLVTGQISSSGTGNNFFVGKTNFGQAKTGAETINLYGHMNQSGSYSLYNNFSSGWAGSGWRIDQNITNLGSNAELDNLTVRKTMKVFELIINQIRATNGSLFVSSVAKVSGSTQLQTNGDTHQTITFEDPTDHGVCPFLENDIIITQRVQLDNSTVVKLLVRKVTAVDGTSITAALLADGPTDVGVVEKGDDFVRIGNTTNTSRQGTIYLTSDDSNAPFQDTINGVASWADWTDKVKLKVRLGNLSGLTSEAFGSLTGYGLYSKGGVYLESDGTASNSIIMKAGSGSAQLTMKQGSNTIFDFDTATSTANIAGWTINSTTLYSPDVVDGLGQTNYVEMIANNASSVVGLYLHMDKNADINLPHYLSFGRIRGASGNYQTNYGIAYKLYSGTTYFELSDTAKTIASWTFDNQKLYTGTDIVLDGTNKKISVAADKVKMYYTNTSNYGISSSVFHLGSTNLIADWTFTNNSFYKTIITPDTRVVSMNSATTGSGNQFWLGTNKGIGFNVMYKSGSWAHIVSIGEMLTDNAGNASSAEREGWWGIQMLGASGSSTPRTYFQMGGKDKVHKNIIAGYNFDYQKLWTGVSSASIVLNTSTTPFLSSTGKGFEVWDLNNPKMFIGKKTGNFLDYNSSTSDTLTISGSIIGSTITGGTIQTATSGQRILINSGSTNTIKWYTSTGKILTMTPQDQGTLPGLHMSASYLYFTNPSTGQSANVDYAIVSLYSASMATLIRAERTSIAGYNVPKYIGEHAANPTYSPIGYGDTYFNTDVNELRVYTQTYGWLPA